MRGKADTGQFPEGERYHIFLEEFAFCPHSLHYILIWEEATFDICCLLSNGNMVDVLGGTKRYLAF